MCWLHRIMTSTYSLPLSSPQARVLYVCSCTYACTIKTVATHIALIETMSVSKLLSDTHPCSVLFCYKVRVSSILDSLLGKAAVKAASITNSDEESVAADKGFSSKDK